MIEKDPQDKNAHAPGAQLDAGKTRLGLVLLGFARALQAVGEVGTFGARKYTENGWVEVENGQARYTDALMRHLMSEARGEKLDPGSGLRHAAQVAWNALARLDLEIRQEGSEGTARVVDRPGYKQIQEAWAERNNQLCPDERNAVLAPRPYAAPTVK